MAMFFRFYLTILWEIVTSVWEFYMLNVKYWRIFCDVISLLAQVYFVSFERVYEVSTKNIIIFVFVVNWLRPYKCVLYKFQIDISTKAPY